MRTRLGATFGQCAYLSIQISADAYPEPPPAFTPVGKPGDRPGVWVGVSSEGQPTAYFVTRHSGSAEAAPPDALFVDQRGEHWWEWWTGEMIVYSADMRAVVRRESAPHLVAPYRARYDWLERYGTELAAEFLAPLDAAAALAMAHYSDISRCGKYVRMKFSVAWHNASYVRRFCAALSRGLRCLRAAGTDARLVREECEA